MPRNPVTNEQLLEALREFEGDGPPVTMGEFCQRTGYSTTLLRGRFGLWNIMRRLAGLPEIPTARRSRTRAWTREAVVAELRRMVDERGPRITFRQFCRQTGIGRTVFDRLCGSWRTLREELGLPDNSPQRRFSDDELLEDLDRLVRHFERLPQVPEIARYSRFSPDAYRLRFGKKQELRKALEKYRVRRELSRRGLAPAALDGCAAAYPSGAAAHQFKPLPPIPQPLPESEESPIFGFPWVPTGWSEPGI